MSTQRFDLVVEPRETGKASSRALRNGRKVPAIVYGATENKNLYIEEGAIVKYNVRAYENAIFNLKSSDKSVDNKIALIKVVDVHPLTRRPQHVDLFALDLKKPVRVYVEVKLEGKPIGLAEGGLLNVVNRQVEIECLPLEIPEALTADISNLGIGDALHASELNLGNVKLISQAELTIAVVNLLEEEVVAPVADAAAAAAPAAGAAAPAAAGKAPAAAGKAAPAKDDKKK